ncbi:MAG: hypothetical protein ACRCTI_11560 [Beijerinckiaceae bacterium]
MSEQRPPEEPKKEGMSRRQWIALGVGMTVIGVGHYASFMSSPNVSTSPRRDRNRAKSSLVVMGGGGAIMLAALLLEIDPWKAFITYVLAAAGLTVLAQQMGG